MIKRGFTPYWQNRRWVGGSSGYQSGQGNPNIIPGGTGPLPGFLILEKRGSSTGEVAFVSPVFTYVDGTNYRFCVHYVKSGSEINAYFLLTICEENGIMKSAGNSTANWESVVAEGGKRVTAYQLGGWREEEDWMNINEKSPTIESSAYQMMIGNANPIYERVLKAGTQGISNFELFGTFALNQVIWSTPVLKWVSESQDVSGIIERAMSLRDMKYWYGGDGRPGTVAQANALRAQYPSIWTVSYYNKALGDLGTPVGDCSYLVNYSYGRARPGVHGEGTSAYLGIFPVWRGVPKNGMIAWRNGHTGIYYNGNTIELVGIDVDFAIRPFDASRWEAVLYSPNITY